MSVGGVTPRLTGKEPLVPIYKSLAQAKAATEADAAAIFSPPQFAAASILEAVKAQYKLVICMTEGIPPSHMDNVVTALNWQSTTRLIGPHCPGIIKPYECMIGTFPEHIIHAAGRIGICFRTCVGMAGMVYKKVVKRTTELGLGQSVCVGIGEGQYNGTDFVDCLMKFEADPQTQGIVIIGNVSGAAEANFAAFMKETGGVKKPVVAFFEGLTDIINAGAKWSGQDGVDKLQSLEESGVIVSLTSGNIVTAMQKSLMQRGSLENLPLSAPPIVSSPTAAPPIVSSPTAAPDVPKESFWSKASIGTFIGTTDVSLKYIDPLSHEKICAVGGFYRDHTSEFLVGIHVPVSPPNISSVQAETRAVLELAKFASSQEKQLIPLIAETDCVAVEKMVCSGEAPSDPLKKELWDLCRKHNIIVRYSPKEVTTAAHKIAHLHLGEYRIFRSIEEIPEIDEEVSTLIDHDKEGLPHIRRPKK